MTEVTLTIPPLTAIPIAAMKFRAYTFMKDNQVLEMRMGALRNAATGLEKVVDRLQPERDAFKADLAKYSASKEPNP